MALENRALVLDLVEWISQEPRAYEEVMAAWRTSCPRLTVWEDALDGGFVARSQDAANGASVHVTDKGLALLRHRERSTRRSDRAGAYVHLVRRVLL